MPLVRRQLVPASLFTVTAVLALTAAPALAAPPEAPTVEVQSRSASAASLRGILNPNSEGEAGTYEFLYKQSATECDGGGHAPESPGLSFGFQTEEVFETIFGLEPNKEYTVCLLAENGKAEKTSSSPLTFKTALTPETPKTEPATEITGAAATLNGVLNPISKGEAGTYEFFYKQSASECQGEGEKATPSEPAAGNTPEPVSAKVTGLLPGTPYTFCLLARNTVGELALGPPETFTTLALPPTVSAEVAANVEASAATLQAQVDPNGSGTTYHFEYDTTPYETSASHGTSTTGVSIGSGTSAVPVSVQLKGLAPGTTYYYRVVAVNGLATIDGPGKALTTLNPGSGQPGGSCPNEQLRAEQPFGLALPDCRAYEMVSPVDKNGADALTVFTKGESQTRASTSGEAISYSSSGSFSGPVGAKIVNQYISRRASGGWSTQSITPPTSAFNTTVNPFPYEDMIFTPTSLSMGITTNGDPPLTSDAPAGEENVYLADTASGAYRLVSNPEPLEEPYNFRHAPELGGASTDLSHVVFAETEGARLSEWIDGHLTVIEPPAPGASAVPGNGQESFTGRAVRWHAVSADGSRVFFTSPAEIRQGETAETPINNQLYVRENGTTTVEASASQRAPEDINGPRGAEFAGASADGSVVFFTSRAELTEDANTGSADNAANLYTYDTRSGQLTDLSVDGNAGDLNGAAVLGMVTTSEDGSYVYYVAEGDLAGAAVSGKPNLYLYHNGTTTLIATLATGDRGDWREVSGGPAGHTVRVTPDGVHLAFLSGNSLTGYDNTDANTGQPDEEVFSYNAGSGVLSCVSCNPSGVRPIGSSSLGDKVSNFYIARNFSEDGSRLFFQSRDALVPHDSNGRQDVYEYEGGHVYPVSDVAGGFDSSFQDASLTGADVFIGTADQLLPQDQDLRVDVYDARVGGGFPVAAVPPPACDNGDACKPPVSPQPPAFGAPASATFSGAGNLTPEPPPPPPAKGKTAAQIRAEHLAKALRACRAKKDRHKRTACEKQARRHFGPAKKASTHSKKGRK